MNVLSQATSHAVRSLVRAPRFSIIASATLALGIGASSAAFSVLDAVLFRPLAVPNGQRVVNLAWGAEGYLQSGLTPVQFEYWEARTASVSAMATWAHSVGRTGAGESLAAIGVLEVTRGFLDVLGWAPALGRDFAPDEHADGSRLVLVTHRTWQDHLAGRHDVLGSTLPLNEIPHTVIGVLPPDFAFPHAQEEVEAIVPMSLTVDPGDQSRNWPAIALLGDGVPRGRAETEVESLFEPFSATYPQQVYERERGMRLVGFGELYAARAVQPLWGLAMAVGVILFIACANVANLFMARAEQRRHSIALRVALGATGGRIGALVLIESIFVSLSAGLVGLILAWCGVTALVGLAPAEIPRLATAGIDWRVLGFTVGLSLATGVVFGGVAAAPVMSSRISQLLRAQSRGTTSPRSRQLLIVGQSALATVVLIGAALFLATLSRLQQVEAGFDPDGLVAVSFAVRPPQYESAGDLWELQRSVIEELRASPTVASVAGATNLPLERGINYPVSVEGVGGATDGTVEWRAVTPSYFETMGIPLLSGRPFEDTDLDGAPAVAIVNEAFRDRFMPEGPMLGARVHIGRRDGEYRHPSLAGPGAEVVGLAQDVRDVSLRVDPRPTVYVPAGQAPTRITNIFSTLPVFIARAAADDGRLEPTLVGAFRAADPTLGRPEVIPLGQVVRRSLARERFAAALLTGLGCVALALTSFGVYGVLSFRVRQRRREIGIRIALGASRAAVARLVVGHGVSPVVIGLAVGAVAALGLSGLVARFLWGVEAMDPIVVAVVAGVLVTVAAVASWLPAREAIKQDPMKTLNLD